MKRIEWLQTATLEEVAMLLVHEGVHIGFDYVYDDDDEYLDSVEESGYYSIDGEFFYDDESAINPNIEFLKEEI